MNGGFSMNNNQQPNWQPQNQNSMNQMPKQNIQNQPAIESKWPYILGAIVGLVIALGGTTGYYYYTNYNVRNWKDQMDVQTTGIRMSPVYQYSIKYRGNLAKSVQKTNIQPNFKGPTGWVKDGDRLELNFDTFKERLNERLGLFKYFGETSMAVDVTNLVYPEDVDYSSIEDYALSEYDDQNIEPGFVAHATLENAHADHSGNLKLTLYVRPKFGEAQYRTIEYNVKFNGNQLIFADESYEDSQWQNAGMIFKEKDNQIDLTKYKD